VLGRKSDVAHNGISVQEISKIKAKRDKNRIITVGRLVPFKNVDLIIKAMPDVLKKNKKAHLVIIGEGPERERLEKLAIGLPVEFKNFVKEHNTLLKEIKSSGVFVTQSSREGFGIIVLEALACGTAVVIPQYLSEFPYAKMCMIANGEMLVEAISNPKKANPESVKDFDWDFIADEMEDIYRGVVR
ncbi:MAG: glycosyltransferase family 4 protein, partial [Nanoarchaeota archaeon]|nr:glycosyltransferase family 4 protein [Nanoarchaeota archaeon]